MLLVLAGGVAAQQAEAPASTDDEPASEAVSNDAAAEDADDPDEESDDETDEDEIDDSDLDLQTYEEDEDDFTPTEEIPADQAIPFPTDI